MAQFLTVGSLTTSGTNRNVLCGGKKHRPINNSNPCPIRKPYRESRMPAFFNRHQHQPYSLSVCLSEISKPDLSLSRNKQATTTMAITIEFLCLYPLHARTFRLVKACDVPFVIAAAVRPTFHPSPDHLSTLPPSTFPSFHLSISPGQILASSSSSPLR